MSLRRIIRILLKTIVGFIGVVGLYLVLAVVLSKIVVNSDVGEDQETRDIYVMTNGVHTDLILPYTNDLQDWRDFAKTADTKSGSAGAQYISFGWGDKGFYLDTKTWADLKVSTAVKALFYLGESAMHVSFYNSVRESESCKKIRITKEGYAKLVGYIKDGFDLDSGGHPIIIKGASYANNDSFYEAQGSYSMFFTCNTWTNGGLKSADLKACLWTPFDKYIMELY